MDQGPPRTDAGRLRRVVMSVPLDGALGSLGRDGAAAAALAIEDAGGGLELVVLDEGGEERFEEQVRANVVRATADDAVGAYLGDFRSAASVVSLPLLERAGLAQVSFSNTYRGLAGGSYFNVMPNDDELAAGLARWMIELGVRRPFLVAADEYGTDVRRGVQRALTAAGVEVVGVAQPSEPGDVPAVDPQADAILLGAVTARLPAGVVGALAAMAPGAAIFAPDGMAYPELAWALDPAVARRVHIAQGAAHPARLSPAAVEVERRLTARIGHVPDPHALYAYEAAALLAEVVPGAERRTAVVERLRSARRSHSILGPYRFDDAGATTLTTTGRLRIVHGRYVAEAAAGPGAGATPA